LIYFIFMRISLICCCRRHSSNSSLAQGKHAETWGIRNWWTDSFCERWFL